MNKYEIMKKTLTLAMFFLVCSGFAHADWEGDFKVISAKGSFPNVAGKFFSKQDRYRVDTDSPFEMSVFASSDSKRVTAAVHSFKFRLSSNPDKFHGQLPACLSKSFEPCIQELKLKKLGSEKCGDHVCDVFEGLSKNQGMKKVKLWHWAGEKEPIFPQSVLTKNDGEEIRTTFTKIERKVHPDSFFAVPPGYKDAGSLENFVDGFRSDSP